MPTGHIISFKDDRGYGFIKADDGSANVYLHISALKDAGIDKVHANQKVSYNLLTTDEKTSAVDIKLIE